jgi:hypothetical protein
MTVTYIGVRHHSPACARLVTTTIRELRPAHVLIEGPADFNDRIGELLLGHRLPIAIFSHGDGHLSWTPFCAYSPEWAALIEGDAAGARVRFIDLPAWHPAFAERTNRYADAEARYTEVIDRLCRAYAVDNTDTLWDQMFESTPTEELAAHLDAYFTLLRSDTEASPVDTLREAHMARWIRAAAATGDSVLVVTGGFHTPALRTLVTAKEPEPDRPDTPVVPDGAGSYLVPYSFRRLDAFGGYQSGMPSPGYYQKVWEDGVGAAGRWLTETVVAGLRRRRQPVSTADLIAARAVAEGLARMRGNPEPVRTDVLDGLAGALIRDDLEQPLPWSRRSTLGQNTHPAVVEMVAALSGDRVGALHPDTPAPPLVAEVRGLLQAHGLDGSRKVNLDLTEPAGLERSRILHRLRVLGTPGVTRNSGLATGVEAVTDERWTLTDDDRRSALLTEAGAFGPNLRDAASARLADRTGDPAGLLFDMTLCGLTERAAGLAERIAAEIGSARDPGPILATVLALWRHDRVFGTAADPVFAEIIDAAVVRVFWLAEGLRGTGAADLARVAAFAAVRDALLHAHSILSLTTDTAHDIAVRIATSASAPPDLRGAAHGLATVLRAAPALPALSAAILGDWLIGLFAVARESLLAEPTLLPSLDELIVALSEEEFLRALPALRQAFEFFPPRERETVARALVARRSGGGSPRSLLRTAVDARALTEARALDSAVTALLAEHGLGPSPAERS